MIIASGRESGRERWQPMDAWLTEPPRGWEVMRLRFCTAVNPFRSELNGLPDETEVSFVPMEAVCEFGGLRLDQTKTLAEVATGYTYFRDGDVLVAKITPCFENGKGSIAGGLTNGLGFGTTELHVLRPLARLDRTFLFYLTISHSFRSIGAAYMYGASGQKRVPDDFVRDFHHPIPPLDEQRVIAAFLDRETARIDTLIQKKLSQIELLKEKRAAIISRAVTKGINSKALLKDSGIDWLGRIPKQWEMKRLKRIATLRSGETITAEAIEQEGDYPVYGGNGLRGFTSSYTHEGERVLIGRQGALCGCVNYATGRFWASEHAVVVTPTAEVQVMWLGELLRTMNLNQYSQSAAQPGLAVENIASLRIPVPPADDQRRLAALIERTEKKAQMLILRIRNSIELLREYRTALISAAVTGKIDTRKEVA